MKKNVFVFPCGSEIGLEIHRSLCFSTHFNIIGGSSTDDHGSFVYKDYVAGVPFVDEPDFIEKINDIIKEHSIDYIIPAHDSVVLKLAEARSEGKLSCEVITSPFETCEITRSKRKTYDLLRDKIATPEVYDKENIEGMHLPTFLKPEIGQGSKGTHLAKTLEELSFYLNQDPTLIALEYLPGNEYTVDCFTDKNGELLFSGARARKRIMNGISVSSESVDENEPFTDLAQKINDNLKFRGAWFFQVKKRENNELVLLEVSPRIAGTMGLSRAKGVNLVLLSLFDAMNYDAKVISNTNRVVIDRALENKYKYDLTYEHVYLDFDDLVIFENKVNPLVIAFVFQCINKGAKVHLLTKHKQDLTKTLEQYRLQGVFDEIIWIEDDDNKRAFIKEENAILIDDSFSERESAQEESHIAVFDAHMIEALIEPF